MFWTDLQMSLSFQSDGAYRDALSGDLQRWWDMRKWGQRARLHGRNCLLDGVDCRIHL